MKDILHSTFKGFHNPILDVINQIVEQKDSNILCKLLAWKQLTETAYYQINCKFITASFLIHI